MTDRSRLAPSCGLVPKDVHHRARRAVSRLAVVGALKIIPSRGEEPQASPSALLWQTLAAGQSALSPRRRMRGAARHVLGGPIELIEERRARRARRGLERQSRRRPLRGSRPPVARIARKHHVVNDERLFTRREELGRPHARWRSSIRSRAFEDVVLRNDSTGRAKRPSGGRYGFDPAAKLDLLRQEDVTCNSVFGGLSRKSDGHRASIDRSPESATRAMLGKPETRRGLRGRAAPRRRDRWSGRRRRQHELALEPGMVHVVFDAREDGTLAIRGPPVEDAEQNQAIASGSEGGRVVQIGILVDRAARNHRRSGK